MMENVAKLILEGLSRQKFADWYNTGRFDDYITGEKPLSEQEILADIVKLFNLDKMQRN